MYVGVCVCVETGHMYLFWQSVDACAGLDKVLDALQVSSEAGDRECTETSRVQCINISAPCVQQDCGVVVCECVSV